MQPTLLLDYEFAVSHSGYVVRALLKLEGRAPAAAARVPLDLSVVLDRSGSMAGEKLEAAREAAALLVRRLRPEDLVSVVAFDDEVVTVATPATGEAQAELPARILDIEAGGSTNLSGGWLRGHELLSAARRTMTGPAADGAMHRVLLMTDGQANVGVTEPERLVGLCRTARAAGITTSTIGFGADYDEHLLRQMADAGGGSAYYIERPDQAPGVFAEELEGLLSIAAQNVAVTIAPSAAVQLVGVHHRYPTTETAEGLRVDLGDLYAREPKALLLEFFVPSLGTSAEPVAIGTVSVLAYVLSEDGGLARQEVTFPIAAPLDLAGKQEPEVRREMLLLEAAKAREAALEARARGDYAAGSDALAAVAPMLAHLAADDAVLREEMADLEAMAGQFAAREVSAADAKYLGQRAYNAHRKKEAYGEKLSRRNRPTET